MNGSAALARAAFCLVLALLAGCASVGPDYQLPAHSQYAQQQDKPTPLDTRGAAQTVARQNPLPGDWWKLYDDAQLNTLVAQALQANIDLKVSAAHLAQAQARYKQAQAAGGWDLNVGGGISRGLISAQTLLLTEQLPVFNFAVAAVSASYQFDMFGQFRRSAEAAKANTEAAAAANDLARISVAAAVTGAYMEICHSNHELQVIGHSLQLQQRTRDIAARLQAAGRGTPVEVARADAQVQLLQAAIPPVQARKLVAGYALAELLGLPPDQAPQAALQCAEAPQLAQPIPVGDGAALLRRRPDVRRAERKLAAATAEIGVATAALYPNISLGLNAGSNGLLDDFGRPVAQEWALGPLISWEVPGRGAHARVELANADQDVALAEFDRAVLNALRETQTVLSSYAEDLQRVQALQQARDLAQKAAADERALYRAGRRPFLSSLDADRTLSNADATLANAQAQVSQDQVKLFLALGGGWQGATAPVGSRHENTASAQ